MPSAPASSHSDAAWRIGRWLKQTGRSAPRLVRPSRGYNYHVNDMLVRIEEILKDKDYTLAERMLVKNPFSIYFGWITVATIANICTWLMSIGFTGGGLSPVFWTGTLLIVGAFVGIAGMLRNTNCAYGAVFIWAYTGILVKHVSEQGWDAQYQVVIGVLWALLAVLTVTFGWTLRNVAMTIKR
jgi:hypothetical protein